MGGLFWGSEVKAFQSALQKILSDSQSTEQEKDEGIPEGVVSRAELVQDIIAALPECSDGGRIAMRKAAHRVANISRSCPKKRTDMITTLLDPRCCPNLAALPSNTRGGVAIWCLELVVNECTETEDASLDALLSGCENVSCNVRAQAFRLLGLAYRRFPQRRDEIVSTVIRGCRDCCNRVRSQTVEQVSELAEARPGRAREIQDVLIEQSTNVSLGSREKALKELEKMAALTPDWAEETSEKLLDLCRYDDDTDVNFLAKSVLARSVHLWPEKTDMIVKHWMPFVWPPNTHSRQEAMSGLALLIERSPIRRKEIAELFLRHLGDPELDRSIRVGHSTLPVAAKAAKGCPEKANEIAAAVLKWSSKPVRGGDRQTALEQLSELLRTDLDCMDEVVDVLITACSSELESERIAGLDRLADAIETCPNKSNLIIETLLRGCSAGSEGVKVSALCQLAKAARLSPERAERIVEVLLQLCGDSNEILRALALDELAQTASTCPQKASLILSRLLHACVDDSVYVRGFAKRNLGHILQLYPDKVAKLLELMIRECNTKEDFAEA